MIAGPDAGGTINVTVEGLNLVNGYTYPDDAGDSGAGAYVASANLIFRNNNLSTNQASYQGGYGLLKVTELRTKSSVKHG